ncbi:hypothetical protein GWO43_30895 [candidate division KSB1 bacterium]|nr:hypothetical protein [candidate division KSB1 bacterium]NIR73079.1 hypothetical protein [candidate division KSB1 bacterium]NIS28320.1 hypothetical protein [candidate division KSB1 bacterium]NIT75189.1 hypothetical protein [candidate division KSB1 bacterium]NIU29026.1 hypothetical protein [candidate division KSB1 bacterium]
MDKFEEYKFFAESTQYLSERRQAATQTYLTVNTAIFAVFGFLIQDDGFQGWELTIVSTPLFLVGIVACSIWYKIITQYKSLIGWRYDQLMEMEDSIENSHQMYRKEYKDFFEPREGKEWFGFSKLERLLPLVFVGLYAAYGIALIIIKAT